MTASLSVAGAAGELELLLRATLLMGGAWVAAAALRMAGASAAARHMAWFLCIAALLALPMLWWFVPALSLPILPVEAAPAAALGPTPDMAPSAAGLTGPDSPGSPEYQGWRLALLAAYALGAVMLLLRLLLGRRKLARLWRDAGAVRGSAWDNLLSKLSSEMRLSRRVEIRISRGPAMPMTWGTLAPKVLLPAEASEWPPERCRLVLLHELAHVARRDSLSRSVASLACALYWFHPGAWLAARRMRLEQEQAADDRVLAAGGSAEAYARSLLHLARAIGQRQHPDLAATMAGTCELERRLVSITNPARRDRPGIAFLSSSALVAALATLAAAAGVPVSASPTLRSPAGPERFGMASPIDKSANPGRAGNASTSETRSASASALPTGSLDAVERRERESAASGSWPEGGASRAAGTAGRASARRGEIAAGEGELKGSGEAESREQRQAPSYALALPDYRWALPRHAANGQPASPGASSRPARFGSPTSLERASKERIGRAKWGRVAPRLTPPGTPTRSAVPTSPGTLMLSWSLDVGP